MATSRWQTIGADKVVRALSIFIVLAALAAGAVGLGGPGRADAANFAAGDRVVVAADALNLRAGPGLSYAVLRELQGDAVLTVAAGPEKADGYAWYQVRAGDGASGWVAGGYLALASGTPPPPPPTGGFAAGDVAVVDTPALNCRTGPGLAYAVDHVMAGGSEVLVLGGPVGADGYHWYELKMADGEAAWAIGEALVPAGEEGGDPAPVPVFAKGAAVVVAADVLNLRVGAGLAKSVVAALPGGTALIISNGPMQTDGYAWYEVETRDGRLGWVAGAYLAAAADGEAAVGDATRVVGGPLNLRAAPGLAAGVLRVLADNEALLVRGGPVEADGYAWYRVWNYGGEGWAAGEFLRPDPNGFPPEGGG